MSSFSSFSIGRPISQAPGNGSRSCSSNSVGTVDGLFIGKIFKSKKEMGRYMQMLAVNESFEFVTPYSDTSRYVLRCIDKKCSWRLRANKYNKEAGSFIISSYFSKHSCDSSLRNINRSQANAKTVGELVSHHFEGRKVALVPKQIMEIFRHDHGVGMSYNKAWRAQEHAIEVARGTPADGYEDLPSWFHMLNVTNPGSVTFIEVDDYNRFKYAFLAFGPSIRGFKLMRKVISIDGSHLKAKFKGTLLGVSAQDGNFQLYPIAFGVVDSENEESWDWFLKCLKTIIPDEQDLVVVSDRAPSIAKAVSTIYPTAHHGICFFHLEKNLETRFRGSALLSVVKDAAYAYTKYEFDALFSELSHADPKLSQYLWEADISKWSRAYAPSNRYNIMTSNLAESLNSMLRDSREYPIVYLFDTIRSILSSWFYERREEGISHRHLVTKKVGKIMTESYSNSARKFEVAPVNRSEFEVKGDQFKHVVNLDERQCTCRFFDIERYPCSHAIAAAKKIHLQENDFVDEFYLNERWVLAYSESIHPIGDRAFWDIPAEVAAYLCLPPSTRIPSGRRKKKRYPSAWEHGKSKSSYKCSRCLQSGHNKTHCVAPI